MKKSELKEMVRAIVKEKLNYLTEQEMINYQIGDPPPGDAPVNEHVSYLNKLISQAMQVVDKRLGKLPLADEEDFPYKKGSSLEKNLGDLWSTLQKANILAKGLYEFSDKEEK